MGWISILKAVLESVHHADQFEYKVDHIQAQMKNFIFPTFYPLARTFEALVHPLDIILKI